MAEKKTAERKSRRELPANKNIVSSGFVVHVSARPGNLAKTLAPGESMIVENQGGKVVELKRTDPVPRSINGGLDRLIAEMPPEGQRVRTDLARAIIEDRE